MSNKFSKFTKELDNVLNVGESFDLIRRTVKIGGRNSVMYMLDGFVKDEVLEKMLEFLIKADENTLSGITSGKAFADNFISYTDISTIADLNQAVTMVLSGAVCLAVDGIDELIIIDARTYPVRSVDEPEDDKVLRGSHDGFVETLLFNVTLIRRRIRDPRLTMELFTIGSSTKTDVVLAYMNGVADNKVLETLRSKLSGIKTCSLNMAQESLAEMLVKKGWYNPFPKVRYTERPDTTAASIMEGKIAILCDNAPSAMLLPVGIFDFVQESNDFYFPPLVGSYLRMVRGIIFLITIFLMPVWYLLVQNPNWIPGWLEFIKIDEPNAVPVIFQILLFELSIDGLKLASLNTPSSLSNSFSVVGALLLGEFAVSAGWFVPEVILYMGFVAIGNFTQTSFELGYAFKLMRISILILTAIFNVWGFAAGVLLMLVLLATNRTLSETGYLYPLIPFNGKALCSLLIRKKKPE